MKSSLPLSLVALAFIVTPAAAQLPTPRRFGLFTGVGVEVGPQNNGWGLQIGGLFTVGLSRRLGVQVGATVQTFRNASGLASTPCLAPSAGQPPCYTYTKYAPLTMASATANLMYSTGPFHGRVGVGAYGVAESPAEGSYTRPGWSLGAALRLWRGLSLDASYHQLIAPRTTRSLVPITVSYHF